MNIGKNCHISDDFFPLNKKINIFDRDGNKLSVGDKVKIRGCTADYGYIGYDNKNPCLYFAAYDRYDDKETSVKWLINGANDELLSRITKCE